MELPKAPYLVKLTDSKAKMETTKQTTLHPQTLVAQAMGEICTITGAVIPPIQVATTYARDRNYETRDGRSYIRDSSPTVEQAENIICHLENGEQGLLFPSGLSACTSAFHGLKNGDHIILAKRFITVSQPGFRNLPLITVWTSVILIQPMPAHLKKL